MLRLFRSALFLLAAIAGPYASYADECPAGPYTLSRRPGHWTLLYRGFEVYTFSSAELNGLYGGKAVPSNCGGIFTDQNSYVGIIVGHDNDLLVAFGVPNDPFKPTILHYYTHDGHDMTPDPQIGQFVVNYGDKHDLWARFCWRADEQKWYHNADHRAGPGPCDRADFPWNYDVSSTSPIK